MKYISFRILIFAAIICFVACDETEVQKDPVINSFNVELEGDTVGAVATFTIDAEADFLSFWNGMTDADYSAVQSEIDALVGIPVTENARMRPRNTGENLTVDTKTFSVTYNEAGVFTAVLVATNVQDYIGVVNRVTKQITFEIKQP